MARWTVLPALFWSVLLAAAPAGADVAPDPESWSPGLTVATASGRPVVESVEPGGPAAEAGVKPGFYVLAVGDVDAATLADYELARTLQGDHGSIVRVIVSDKHGAVHILDLPRTLADW